MAGSRLLTATTAIALGFLVGCGPDDVSVMLEAKLESPRLTVTERVLTTEVDGSFDIALSLGDLASDPTTVKLGVFTLERNDQALLPPLDLDTTPHFPITVNVGSEKSVQATFGAPADSPPELAAELCAGELRIRGTLTDTLGDDRSHIVTSAAFLPECSLLN